MNAFFYWTNIPAEDPENLIVLDEWAAAVGAQFVRVEKWQSQVSSLVTGFRSTFDVFLVVSTPEELPDGYIVRRKDAGISAKLFRATESTTRAPLGQIPWDLADEIRYQNLKIRQAEEEAGAMIQETPDDLKKPDHRLAYWLTGLGLLGCLEYLRQRNA